jgi:arabinogalactan endo-1,4-beta-galactosidase
LFYIRILNNTNIYLSILKNNITNFLFFILFFIACNKSDNKFIQVEKPFFIKGVDASFIPEIRLSNMITKNANGQVEDMLLTLKNAGVNTIRLRIWNNPVKEHSGLEEVKNFSNEIKNLGLKVWLTIHYSDTWADPGAQTKPSDWNGLTFVQLKDSLRIYTSKIVNEIKPDYIQIGNEINNGFLWPEGSFLNQTHMLELLKEGIKAVKENSPQTKIIIHYAGYDKADYFYRQLSNLDYDIIGLSYYPNWHGKSLDTLQMQLLSLSSKFNKPILIAETAYPFTYGWNDWTNNIIGDSSQILPQFTASIQGQKDYLSKIKYIISNTPNGIGFAYWGAEFISFKGSEAKNGSTWENQALWDFTNKALPAICVFKD